MQRRLWSIATLVVSCSLLLMACATEHTEPSATIPSTRGTFPVRLIDEAGHQVVVSRTPIRIASLTEGTDEILSALVPKTSVKLMTSYAADPNESNIGSFGTGIPKTMNANPEEIISVQPDLVLLASYTPQGVYSQLQQAGITAYEFTKFNSVADIERNIQIVGQLTGTARKAHKLVENLMRHIAAIRHAVASLPHPRVLDYSSYGYVAGRDTTVSDVIVDGGGVNAAQNIEGWKQVTDEQLVEMNPDVIIVGSDDATAVTKIKKDPALSTVTAVRTKRVYVISAADLTSVSEYVYRGVWDVAHTLYPKLSVPQ